jgi:plastocyanin
MRAHGWVIGSALLAAAWLATGLAPAPAVGEKSGARVGMTNSLAFKPAKVTIDAGQSVLWENSSGLVHTVTADPSKAADKDHVRLPKGAKPFDSGRLLPGKTFEHTFTVPGRYRYFCIPHESAGMVAEVIVRK